MPERGLSVGDRLAVRVAERVSVRRGEEVRVLARDPLGTDRLGDPVPVTVALPVWLRTDGRTECVRVRVAVGEKEADPRGLSLAVAVPVPVREPVRAGGDPVGVCVGERVEE